MPAALLTCHDPLRPRRPDPHFAAAAAAVRERGGVVTLLDHEALMRGRAADAVAAVERGLGPLWYCGWMLPGDRYADLESALAERGSGLVTDARRYRRAHELPGWYATFAEVTPRSVWLPVEPGAALPADGPAGLAALLGPGPAVVKDYVKSRKHEWDEACFVPDTADTVRLTGVVERFLELQEDSLVGGIVLRSFEEFRGDELRVWWIDAAPVLTTAHPDARNPHGAALPQPDLDALAPLVRALGNRFVTTDLARRDDGVWRVVEVGDGQVSDLPEAVDPRRLLGPLLDAPVGRD
ncbi:ATP-grasp domain-containing protein [Streptomyces sp. VRA16 Mangrove soil]|uniref:ATP-grasp domain-containing protein n=1 Tax=Streptomyces sp. VRA16 Mangrove soil TaxID=2817434 RepID=UPI001A9EE6AE|nr:ATP-grasp domain-containing protein [Streptomyces sp. VRA16 Mangrove soil]MBO1334510.1 ATP-grasp domain-containing protein [Streptomyces sp. VRA16 Mangrove soil]